MTIADNEVQRQAWLARVACIQLQMADLRRDLDIAARRRPGLSIVRLLAECDVHLNVAAVELAEAAARIRNLP